MYKSYGLIQRSLVQTHGVQLLSVFVHVDLYMLVTLCYAFALMCECMISYLMSEI
jgi:hypothetical protein